MKLNPVLLLTILLIMVVLISGCTQIQSNQGAMPNETGSNVSVGVTIPFSSCTSAQRTDEYGDTTNLNQIRFSGTVTGPIGSRLEVFLIEGGGVPENNALQCTNWEKVSGVNACISDGSDATWSFYWEDYSPSTIKYSIRARISGIDQTATARC